MHSDDARALLEADAQAMREQYPHAYATYGRTDVRTYAEDSSNDENSRNVTRAGGQNEFIPTSEFQRLTQALYNDEIVRAPVVRRGERSPINALVRQLVYRRDQWTCQHCGARPFATEPKRRSGALHLDHIVPWSAGGTDRSDNLRTLCGPCNESRSNFVSSSDRLAMPIVRICAFCLSLVNTRIEAILATQPETFPVYCGSRSHQGYAIRGWRIL